MKTDTDIKLLLSVQPSWKSISHSFSVHFSIDQSYIRDVTAVSVHICAAGIGTTELDWVMLNLEPRITSKHNGKFIIFSPVRWLYVNWWGYKRCTNASLSLAQVLFHAGPLCLGLSVTKTCPKGLRNVPHNTTHHTAFSWESSV